MTTNKISLYDALVVSTLNNKQRVTALKKYGYVYDSMLSDKNNSTYYNPKTNKLLFNVKGTNPKSIQDIYTDVRLAGGQLKGTARYQDSKFLLAEAKRKYKGATTDVSGYSLGGTIAGYIAGADDDVFTYNKGATIGQPIRANETAYRTSGDIVSLADAGATRMKSLNKKATFNPLKAHELTNIKNENIFID